MSIVGMRRFMQGRLQHIMLALAFVFAVGWIGLCLGSGRFSEKEQPYGGAIAKVNGEKLEWKTFEDDFERTLHEIEDQQGGRMLSAFEESMIRTRMFEERLDRALRAQAAKKGGIEVSRREVKSRIDKVVKDGVNEQKGRLLAGYKGKKTDQAFDAELRKYDTSLGDLRSRIRQSINRDEVREQLVAAKLDEKLRSSVDSSDKAVRRSFDEVRFRQITIGTQGRSAAAAERRASELVARLRKGADFAPIAKEYSEDPFKAAGGDRGYPMRRAYMESELANVVLKLKPGEIGGPIKMPLGYTIVKVEERRSALPADFNDPKKRKQYRDAYLAQERARVLREYPEKLRKTAVIEIYDPELRGHMLLRDISAFSLLSPSARKAKLEAAIREFQKALERAGGNSRATARASAEVGYLYDLMRRPEFGLTSEERVKCRDEAKKALQAAWECSGSNDLDVMLAEIYIEEGKQAKALDHLEIASQNAIDRQTHFRLMAVLEAMKGSGSAKVAELIAQERQWQAEYDRQVREQQGMLGEPPPTAPAPNKDKPGG